MLVCARSVRPPFFDCRLCPVFLFGPLCSLLVSLSWLDHQVSFLLVLLLPLVCEMFSPPVLLFRLVCCMSFLSFPSWGLPRQRVVALPQPSPWCERKMTSGRRMSYSCLSMGPLLVEAVLPSSDRPTGRSQVSGRGCLGPGVAIWVPVSPFPGVSARLAPIRQRRSTCGRCPVMSIFLTSTVGNW